MDTLILQILFFEIKLNIFWGDLTDVSAEPNYWSCAFRSASMPLSPPAACFRRHISKVTQKICNFNINNKYKLDQSIKTKHVFNFKNKITGHHPCHPHASPILNRNIAALNIVATEVWKLTGDPHQISVLSSSICLFRLVTGFYC